VGDRVGLVFQGKQRAPGKATEVARKYRRGQALGLSTNPTWSESRKPYGPGKAKAVRGGQKP
jgi:hypothetical protein